MPSAAPGGGDGPGHLFQGRYKAEMIEDESYYWTVSRYIHLNPVRAGLVARPEAVGVVELPGLRRPRAGVGPGSRTSRCWPHGEGIAAATTRVGAYVRFVEAGLPEPPPSPFREAFGGWVLGSARFVDRLRTLAGPVAANPPRPRPGNSPGSTRR